MMILERTAVTVGILAALAIAAPASADDVMRLQSKASFADAVSNVEDAIVNRGYVVDYRGHIGDMLKRTEKDVGATKPLFKNAQFLQFCSAVLSRKAIERDHQNIAYCPYVIFVYEAEDEPSHVYVGHRKLPPGEDRDAINILLDEIIKEAAGK